MATERQRGNQWIIKIQQWYLKHPRGEWTKKPSEAHGYHYKGTGVSGPHGGPGAEDEAIAWRKYMALRTDTPPGTLPPGGFRRGDSRSVQVMRRSDGLDLDGTPEPAPTSEPRQSPVRGHGTMAIMCVGLGHVNISPEAEHSIARFVVSVGLNRRVKFYTIDNGVAIDSEMGKDSAWTRIATVGRSAADPIRALFDDAYDYIIKHDMR